MIRSRLGELSSRRIPAVLLGGLTMAMALSALGAPSAQGRSTIQEILKNGVEGFADSRGVPIHYVSMGEGPLVIMIHGFPDFWFTWRDQMPALSRRFKVVAISQRGYYKSGQPRGVEHYTMDKLTGDVDAVRAHFKADKAIVVGHDWGGWVAWSYAMAYPEKLDRLIVVNLPHPKGIDRELTTNPQQAQNSQYARNMQEPDSAAKVDVDAMATRLAARYTEPELKRLTIEAFKRSSIEAMHAYYKNNYPRPPYKDDRQYPPVKSPVLLFHGLNDTALLPGMLNDTWKWVEKDLTLVTLPGVGHWAQTDAADLVTRTMLNWLNR
jgi:pimeloyl-ACP methyl ester carboxylesterase